MPRSYVLTLIGPDSPGLVERLAEAVADAGGNWVESEMSRLAGQFAGILRVQLPGEASLEKLREGLGACAKHGLEVQVHAGRDEADEAPGATLHLEVVGSDPPGIVREISRAIAARGVNVVHLETRCEGAPWSGEALFRASATLSLPEDADEAALREDLEAIALDLMVETTWSSEQ